MFGICSMGEKIDSHMDGTYFWSATDDHCFRFRRFYSKINNNTTNDFNSILIILIKNFKY